MRLPALLILLLHAGICAGQGSTFSDYFATSDDYALRTLATELEGRADTLLGRAIDSVFTENFPVVERLAEEAMERPQDRPLALTVRALGRLGQDRYRLALSDLDAALLLDPTLMLAYSVKGKVHLLREERDLARLTYERAAAALPASPVPPFLIGALEAVARHPVRARKYWEQSVERDACYVPARLGVLLERLLSGRRWKGVRELQELLECDELSPAVYALMAETATWSGDYEAAIGHLTSALSLSPENAEYLLTRADYYRRLDRFPEALNDLNYAYAARYARQDGDGVGDLQISNPRKEMEYALNHYRFRARVPEAAHPHYAAYLLALHDRAVDDYRKCERELIRAGEEDRPVFRYLQILAGQRQYRKDYDPLPDLDRVLAAEPDIVDLHRLRGEVMLERGEYREAYNSFRRMGELESGNIPSLKGMAMVVEQTGRQSSALNFYRQILKLDSTDLYALTRIGDAYFKAGNYPAAAAYYERGLEWYPRHAAMLHQLAAAMFLLNRPDRALEHIHTLPEQYFTVNPEVINLRGLARLQLDSVDAAKQDFNQVIMVRPHLYEAYINRARVNIKMGNWESARKELDYVIEHAPDMSSPYALRAIVRAEAGEDCCADLAAAAERGFTVGEAESALCPTLAALIQETR